MIYEIHLDACGSPPASVDGLPLQNVEKDTLAEELKLCCTNVMLQCLDVDSRCIFILGTMLRLDSRIAADLLEMTPEAYRQRLMIKPSGQSFLGDGLFADMFKDATAMVRDFIVQNGNEWENIIHELAFKKHFTVQGNALKNVLTGYDKDHPQAEYLKYKSWYLEYPIKDAELRDAHCYSAQFLLYDYLRWVQFQAGSVRRYRQGGTARFPHHSWGYTGNPHIYAVR